MTVSFLTQDQNVRNVQKNAHFKQIIHNDAHFQDKHLGSSDTQTKWKVKLLLGSTYISNYRN